MSKYSHSVEGFSKVIDLLELSSSVDSMSDCSGDYESDSIYENNSDASQIRFIKQYTQKIDQKDKRSLRTDRRLSSVIILKEIS